MSAVQLGSVSVVERLVLLGPSHRVPRVAAARRDGASRIRGAALRSARVLPVVLVLAAGPFVHAAELGEIEWIEQFGGTGPASESAHGVAADGAGHVYVAGETNGTQFDPSTGQETVNHGLVDAVVRKYTSDGTLLWARQPGTPFVDQALAVATDGAGGVYVAGRTQGTFPSFTNAGGFDIVIWKYDAGGSLVWTRQMGGVNDEIVHAIAADASGATVAGTTASSLFSANAGLDDAFAAKCSAIAGALLWQHQFGTSGLDSARGASADASGVYVVGETHGTLFAPNAGGPDVYVRKFTVDGAPLWGDQFGSPIVDTAEAVHSDGDGVYVVGLTTASLFEANAGAAGTRDIFVAKYDAGALDGSRVWAVQLGAVSGGTSQGEQARAVHSDGAEVHVTGETAGSLFGTQAGLDDGFVFSFDAAAATFTMVSASQFGSAFVDAGRGVAADATGVYVAGSTFDAVFGQVSQGDSDGFVHKYPVAPSAAWTDQFGDPAGPAVDGAPGTVGAGAGVAAAVSAGSVYVVGQTSGLLGDVTSGGQDAFAVKFDDAGGSLWSPPVRQFGSLLGDAAHGAAIDPASGALYVAGVANDKIEPDGVKFGNQDGFVRKYGANGAVLWTRQFGTAVVDVINGAASDATGVHLVGQTTSVGGGDITLRKYDPAGNLVSAWMKTFGSDRGGEDVGLAVAAHSTAGVVVGGRSRNGMVFATGGFNDSFVRRFLSDGSVAWTVQLGALNAFDRVKGLAIDESGVYAGGATDNALPGQTSAGSRDGFLVKYDLAGAEVWSRQFGTEGFDEVLAVSVDATGVYVAGVVAAALPGQEEAGLNDAFVRKYDKNGNEIWTLQYGTVADDDARGIAVDSSGLYVVGTTQGALGPESAGLLDVYLARLAQVLIVTIDIKPGEFPNSINLRSNGKVPVAILSSPTFNAAQVDPSTVLFAGAPVVKKPNGSYMASVKDVNGDGRKDLELHFRTDDLQLHPGDVEAQLDGRTVAGQWIRGTDSVRIVGPGS